MKSLKKIKKLPPIITLEINQEVLNKVFKGLSIALSGVTGTEKIQKKEKPMKKGGKKKCATKKNSAFLAGFSQKKQKLNGQAYQEV